MDFIESYRVCVYVPEEALEGFVKAVGPAIPAFLGNYDHVCWWSEAGVEQSRHIDGGRIKRVSCSRFEFSMPCDDSALERFIEHTIVPNHPWQEPVITVCRQNLFHHRG